jgi:hypothetical protein
MALGVGGFQVGDCEPGIMLEGIKRFVAEEFLNVVHVGAAPEHFSGAASPEGMRGHVDGRSHMSCGRPHDEPEPVVGKPRALRVEEHGLLVWSSYQIWPDGFDVRLKIMKRRNAQRQESSCLRVHGVAA